MNLWCEVQFKMARSKVDLDPCLPVDIQEVKVLPTESTYNDATVVDKVSDWFWNAIYIIHLL